LCLSNAGAVVVNAGVVSVAVVVVVNAGAISKCQVERGHIDMI
jgi:hypothetical protein